MFVYTLCIVSALRIVAEPSDTWAAAPFGAEFNISIQVFGSQIIQWYRIGNKPLPKNGYQTITPSVNQTTITLTIPNVTCEDNGLYFCEVWANRMAVRSRLASLSCTGKMCTLRIIIIIINYV